MTTAGRFTDFTSATNRPGKRCLLQNFRPDEVPISIYNDFQQIWLIDLELVTMITGCLLIAPHLIAETLLQLGVVPMDQCKLSPAVVSSKFHLQQVEPYPTTFVKYSITS